jgi:hypothetical protein
LKGRIDMTDFSSGKTLTDLRMEIELGLAIYHLERPDVQIRYCPETTFLSVPATYTWFGERTTLDFSTLDDLLGSIVDTDRPVWVTIKTPARFAFEKRMQIEALFGNPDVSTEELKTPNCSNPSEE